MKKIVFLALIVSFVFSLSISYKQIKNDEIEKLATMEREIATPFIIPKHETLTNPDEVYPLLEKAAKKARVNLFRAGRYFRPDEQIEMMKYVLLTNETSFFHHVQLKNGRSLRPEETLEDSWFLSSMQTKDENQVGRILYFDPQQPITIQALKTSYDYLPVHGRYFAEAKNNEQFQFFLETFTSEINTFSKNSFTQKDFQPPEAFAEPQARFFTMSSLSTLKYEQYILFFLTILLMIYYIFHAAKQVGILKMHGVSNLRVWWIITGRLITGAVVVTALGSILFAFGLYKPEKFVYQAMIQLGQAYLILIFLSLLCYWYISTINVGKTIKNKKDTQGIFILNMVLKVICAAVLIVLGLKAFAEYADLRDQQDRFHAQQGQLDNWGNLKDYGFVEAYAGHTTAYNLMEYEEEMSRSDSILYKLYLSLNANGALYIDAGEYEKETLLSNQHFSGIISVMVNPNYLQAFPLYDHQDNLVSISENTTDWVVLVPEKYQDREKEIRDYFEREEEIRKFYLVEDEGQEMKIIWMANDQYIFSFNPEVFPSEQNMILDPIIHVKTEKNHLFTYRSGTKGRGLRDPLKLKLINNDPALTYEKLEPDFKQFQVDDRMNIVSFHEYLSTERDFLYGEMRNALFQMLGIIGVFIFLIVQNVMIFFHKHQKLLVVKRLFGIGFFKTYQSYFSWFAITSITFMVVSFIVDQTQDFQLINGVTDPHFLLIVFSLLCIEIVAAAIAFTIFERRSKIKMLKGGDS